VEHLVIQVHIRAFAKQQCLVLLVWKWVYILESNHKTVLNFIFTSIQLLMSPHNHIRRLRTFANVQVVSYIHHDRIVRLDGKASSPDAKWCPPRCSLSRESDENLTAPSSGFVIGDTRRWNLCSSGTFVRSRRRVCTMRGQTLVSRAVSFSSVSHYRSELLGVPVGVVTALCL